MNFEFEPPAESDRATASSFVPASTSPSRKKVWSVLARGLGAACMLVALWLGLPFASGGTLAMEQVNDWVLAGTLIVVAVSFGYAMAETSLHDALLLFVLGFVLTWAAEASGVRWGVPFGRPYQYHEDLRPRLWGDVPLFIPLAWYVLLRVPPILLRRWKTWGVSAGGRRTWRQVLSKAGVSSVFMAGCSLILDPLGVGLGVWTWSRPNHLFELLLMNAIGWAFVGYVVHAVYFALERGHPEGETAELQRMDREPLAFCFLFQVLAFIAIDNRLQSWLPAVIAVVVMAPLWGYWWLSISRPEDGEPCPQRIQ